MYISTATDDERMVLEAMLREVLDNDDISVTGLVTLVSYDRTDDVWVAESAHPPRGVKVFAVGTQLGQLLVEFRSLEKLLSIEEVDQSISDAVGWPVAAYGDGSLQIGCKDLSPSQAEEAVAFIQACIRTPNKDAKHTIDDTYLLEYKQGEGVPGKEPRYIWIDEEGAVELKACQQILRLREAALRKAGGLRKGTHAKATSKSKK